MIKVSIIIPVYNAEQYLKKCLDSVCRQTLKDIEVICVNDCSSDNSLVILQEYAVRYPQLRIVNHIENGGESRARNTGIEAATGEYLGFVDNDDVVDMNFYEKLYDRACETGADIVKGRVVMVGTNKVEYISKLNVGIKDNKWEFYYEWWSAIFRRSMIKENKLSLPEGYVFGGDSHFLHYAVSNANKVEVVDDVFYHWLRRENSGESEILSYQKVVSALQLFDDVCSNNNRNLNAKKVDELSYDMIFRNCFDVAVAYVFRNGDIESKNKCAEYALKYYQKCLRKKELEQHIFNQHMTILEMITKNALEELKAYLSVFDHAEKYIMKNQFALLRNRRKNA